MSAIRQQTITLRGQEWPVTVRKGFRTRSLRVMVKDNGAITVSVPSWATQAQVAEFIRTQTPWMERTLERTGIQARTADSIAVEHAHYRKHRNTARAIITPRVEYFAKVYGARYEGLAIRNQASRWGSCSSKGRLNFNYRMMFLTPELLDYIVVHEICHLFEMNHSARFWALVGRAVPEYEALCRELKRFSAAQIPGL